MVRVRFAPSPTGFPHIGNARTALFNYLFARHQGGAFVLRIEDTDVARKVEGAVEAILKSLRWLGLDWDEGPGVGGPFGPYFQSQRLPLYQEAARRLVSQGDAYLCFCSQERLEQLRREQQAKKQPPGYDRLCRSLTPEEREERLKQGITPVVRFATPVEGETPFNDLIRGEVVFDNRTLDDFVLLKSDGFPTYHLANVVDDHAMEITHILRADEWLSSTPRHMLLYQALSYQPPLFAHLPMILGTDRSKLSKRHGAVSVTEFREMGYLPEALLNFMSLLGWALDDRTELFSREELARHFSLEGITRNPAIFNMEKLDWMNGVYIRKLSLEGFVERALPFLDRGLPASVPRPLSRDYLLKMAPFLQERARTLKEVPGLADFFFLEELEYDPALLMVGIEKELKKQGLQEGALEARSRALRALERASPTLEKLQDFTPEALEGLLRPMAGELGLSTGAFFGLLRIATTGRPAAPPLFHTMAILGQERCLKRMKTARQKLAHSEKTPG